jgi:hypothetical protein
MDPAVFSSMFYNNPSFQKQYKQRKYRTKVFSYIYIQCFTQNSMKQHLGEEWWCQNHFTDEGGDRFIEVMFRGPKMVNFIFRGQLIEYEKVKEEKKLTFTMTYDITRSKLSLSFDLRDPACDKVQFETRSSTQEEMLSQSSVENRSFLAAALHREAQMISEIFG